MQETPKAAAAYARYVALGADRSLDKLAHLICQEYPARKPATVLVLLKRWSAAFDWQGRIGRLARQQQLDAEFAERERVRQILSSGLALPHERIERLSRIARLLEVDLTGDKLWLEDFKSIGNVAVPIERPNAAWVSQYRGLLDDIAKEVGQRKPKDEEQAKGGGADERAVALMSDDERARRVAELLERGRARGAGPAPESARPAP